MQVASALAALKSRLDELAGVRWSDEELRRWLSEGVQLVGQRTQWKRSTADLSVSANQLSVPLGSLDPPVYKIYRVEWRPSDGSGRVHVLDWVSLSELDRYAGPYRESFSGVPELCSDERSGAGLELLLYPKPSIDGTVRIAYTGVPGEVPLDGSGDLDELDVPAGWDRLPVAYAEYRAFRADGRLDIAREAEREFWEGVEAMSSQMNRWSSIPRVSIPFGGFDGTWW